MENQTDEKPWGMEVKTFLTLMHLSQLTSFVVPGAGLILPIVMWATNREKFPEIDIHGKVILNWMVSVLIYCIVAFILTFVFIGILLFIAIGICNLIFVILAAVKAGEGEVWEYPLSIRFFRMPPALP